MPQPQFELKPGEERSRLSQRVGRLYAYLRAETSDDALVAGAIAAVMESGMTVFPEELKRAVRARETPQRPMLALLSGEGNAASDEIFGMGESI